MCFSCHVANTCVLLSLASGDVVAVCKLYVLQHMRLPLARFSLSFYLLARRKLETTRIALVGDVGGASFGTHARRLPTDAG